MLKESYLLIPRGGVASPHSTVYNLHILNLIRQLQAFEHSGWAHTETEA